MHHTTDTNAINAAFQGIRWHTAFEAEDAKDVATKINAINWPGASDHTVGLMAGLILVWGAASFDEFQGFLGKWASEVALKPASVRKMIDRKFAFVPELADVQHALLALSDTDLAARVNNALKTVGLVKRKLAQTHAPLPIAA